MFAVNHGARRKAASRVGGEGFLHPGWREAYIDGWLALKKDDLTRRWHTRRRGGGPCSAGGATDRTVVVGVGRGLAPVLR